jgi:hypothetical protein
VDVELPTKKQQLANGTLQGLSLARGKNIIPEVASPFFGVFDSSMENFHNVVSGLSIMFSPD